MIDQEQYELYVQEQDGPDWASIQEAEAILRGEIPADEITKNKVRSWLSKQVTWAAAVQVGRCLMLCDQVDRDFNEEELRYLENGAEPEMVERAKNARLRRLEAIECPF